MGWFGKEYDPKRSKKEQRKNLRNCFLSQGNGRFSIASDCVFKTKIQIKTQFQSESLEDILKWEGKIRVCMSLKNLLPLLGNQIKKEESPNLLSITTITRFGKIHLTKKPCFGILFGKNEGIHALGVLSNSDIFPDRANGGLHSETWIYPSAAKTDETISWESILEKDRNQITKKQILQKQCMSLLGRGLFPLTIENYFYSTNDWMIWNRAGLPKEKHSIFWKLSQRNRPSVSI